MREPEVGLAFILVQTSPGTPFVHAMCLPTCSSCMQRIIIKEMGTLLMFSAILLFHFPVHDVPILPHRLPSTDTFKCQNFSRGNDTSAQTDDAASDDECPTLPDEVSPLPSRASL